MNIDISEDLMKKLRQCELNILKCYISVCQKIGVKYFLVGGTLLGAVRHQGFIPWDDDIDVGMLRKDYEVFLKKSQQYLPEYYFLQTFETDPEFPHNFAKIRDSRTTFIETTTKNINMNHGVFIDIFPFDYYPENSRKAKSVEFRKKIIKSRIDEEFVFKEPIQRSAMGKLMVKIAKVVYPQVSRAVKAREKIYRSCISSTKVTNFCGIWGKKEIVPKSWLDETCKLQFECIQADCPKFYKEYLTNVYGDYMKLPPVEKRIGHHYTEIIDMNKPYTAYMDHIEKLNV